MRENIDFMPENLKHVAESLKTRMPFYGEILDFYRKVFTAQEEAKAELDLPPVTIAPEILKAKLAENLPLVHPSEFAVDLDAAGRLFQTLCDLAEAENPTLGGAVKKLRGALDRGEISLSPLFRGYLEDDTSLLDDAADKLEITREQLSFFVLNSIKPSLARSAEQLAALLEGATPHPEGYCPICGTPAGLSILEGEGGKRFLHCSCCTHRWESRRISCPYCHNRDTGTLGYFYSETEKEYRVDLCDKCNRYIKTVDTRDLARFIYPDMELIATMHLDIKASENGYLTGSDEKNLQ